MSRRRRLRSRSVPALVQGNKPLALYLLLLATIFGGGFALNPEAFNHSALTSAAVLVTLLLFMAHRLWPWKARQRETDALLVKLAEAQRPKGPWE